jgi:hypothetical protein
VDVSGSQRRIGANQDRFYGKYRGTVKSNLDPEHRGRLQVEVLEVRGKGVLDWALPASPYAGDGVGFFALPPEKANVWVEYEGGMMNIPIWSGCFWERGQIAAADAVPDVMFLKTKAASLRIDNATGEIKIEIGGASVTLTASEVKIEAPQITSTASGATTQLTAAGFDALQGALKVI